MHARAALVLVVAALGCRPGAGADEAGGSETGDGDGDGDGEPTGDGDGEPELPGWDCDPIAWLAGSSPAAAPGLSESGSGIAVVSPGDRVLVCREGAPLELWSTAADALSLIATVELAGPGCKRIAVTDDGLRAAVSDPGTLDAPGFVQLVDLGEPAAPLAGSSVAGTFEGLAFAEGGAALLAAARDQGVEVFAITAEDELEPRPGFVDASSDSFALALVDDELWVAEGVHGLRRLTWAGSAEPPVLGASVALAGVAQDLAVAELGGVEHLLVANLGGVVAIERQSGTIASTGPTRGVGMRLASLGDDRVALADWDALRIVDFADVGAPTIVGHQGELGGVTGGLFGVRDVLALGPDRLLSSGLRGLELWAYDRDCAAPALASERRRLHFAPDRDDRVLNLLNEGGVELEILALQSDDPSVSALPSSFVLAPGGIEAVEVAIDHGDARVSTLEIFAIDPELGPGRIELCADCPGLSVGAEAPPLVHVDTDGELWSRERMAGRVVMLAYFATWCGTCNEDLPVFEIELWQGFRDAGGLVLGLADQSPELVVAWARELGLSFPLLLQQDSYERWEETDEFGPYSLDVVIDRDGVTRAIAHGGEIDDWVALFESLL